MKVRLKTADGIRCDIYIKHRVPEIHRMCIWPLKFNYGEGENPMNVQIVKRTYILFGSEDGIDLYVEDIQNK